ncbi:hemolysin [Lentinula guzmanii]|uniref:Hemolysin n=1 Tax=Lentinula guzmanii TaxID=2804957 RepID=A0AA38J823_9AGAR|nr:hemolysin [Lentinula guzmanii]
MKKYSLILLLARNVFAAPFKSFFGTYILASTNTNGLDAATRDDTPEYGSPEFWWKMGISVLLTLGLMGLDELHLRVLAASSDNPTEKKNAKKVLKLMSKGRHWVLVVLLLGNVIVNESLPIFLDGAIGGGIAAVIISTTAIVIFGIIPQAVSVRFGLSIGAKCAPLYSFLSPIAYPTAKLLDKVLGANEAHTYKKAELKSFLQFHRTGEEPLRDDEISILNGVLELNTKSVESIMTPIKDVVKLSADTILDHKTLDAILSSGYSRFPIHEPGNPLAFVGLLLIKKLLQYDPSQSLPISSFPLSILPEAPPTINCFQALDYFQTGRAHLLLISSTPGYAGGALGVITLEDIIEEIISEEIVDETDRYEDNVTTIMRGIVERERKRDSFSSYKSFSNLAGGAGHLNFGSIESANPDVDSYGDHCTRLCTSSFSSDES